MLSFVQPWPVSEVGSTLQVVTSYDGPYSFVVDIQNDLSPSISSTYRYIGLWEHVCTQFNIVIIMVA
jgi:hypothetical protein